MDKRGKETDALYETIRKELNSIISDTSVSSKHDEMTQKLNTKPMHSKTESFDEDASIKTETVSPDIIDEAVGDVSKLIVDPKSTLDENVARIDIDADIRKMQANLRQSYELFQTVGDKFESINFICLKNRIKDLHLSSNPTSNQQRAVINRDLRGMLEKNYIENNIDKLTTDMSEKFRAHPGEFGDIPEISAFFQACSQLEHGLDELKRQRNDINDIGNRVGQAVDMANDRIIEIKAAMNERKSEVDID